MNAATSGVEVVATDGVALRQALGLDDRASTDNRSMNERELIGSRK